MSSASRALQASIFQTLSTDPGVLGALGGPRIYDHVPRGAAYPYVTFGQSTVRDWSTGGDEGDEHVVTLHVWSLAAGRNQVHDIVGALRVALHDRDLTLAGHRLVNLRHEHSEARREADGERFHGIVRLRAVTEPLG